MTENLNSVIQDSAEKCFSVVNSTFETNIDIKQERVSPWIHV